MIRPWAVHNQIWYHHSQFQLCLLMMLKSKIHFNWRKSRANPILSEYSICVRVIFQLESALCHYISISLNTLAPAGIAFEESVRLIKPSSLIQAEQAPNCRFPRMICQSLISNASSHFYDAIQPRTVSSRGD